MTDPVTFAALTPRLSLPLLFSGQAQKEVTVNEALLVTDLLLHACIEAMTGTPPTAPVNGQGWLIGPSPSGAWTGKAGLLAFWSEGGWRFTQPSTGMRVFDRSTGANRLYNGAWSAAVAPAVPSGGTVIDGDARRAIIDVITALRSAGIFATS